MLLALAALILGLSSGVGATTSLLGMRTGNHGPDSLRLVFDLGGKMEVHPVRAGVSEDWILRFPSVCPGAAPISLARPHPLLDSIEGSCSGVDFEVRLRARTAVGVKSFLLPAGKGKPWRLVVDVRSLRQAGLRAEPERAAAQQRGADPAPSKPAPRKKGAWRIVVDPGHGGHDPGARGRGLQEKEIVLDVSRRVVEILNDTPGFEAQLTRRNDRFIGLRQRRRMAEEREADAFLSVHVNAARKSKAVGVEVFFLSLGGASDEASRELARLENEADPDYVVEEDNLLEGIPFGFDLRQSDTLMRSSRLAESILTSLEGSQLAASRGVKQAGFAVLKSFQVPSILVEIGFLSNPSEAKRLKDDRHRTRLARSIAEGTVGYFEKYARARAETIEGTR